MKNELTLSEKTLSLIAFIASAGFFLFAIRWSFTEQFLVALICTVALRLTYKKFNRNDKHEQQVGKYVLFVLVTLVTQVVLWCFFFLGKFGQFIDNNFDEWVAYLIVIVFLITLLLVLLFFISDSGERDKKED